MDQYEKGYYLGAVCKNITFTSIDVMKASMCENILTE